MGQIFSAALVLLICVVAAFIISRGWIALVDTVGARLLRRFRKRDAPPVWHTREDSPPTGNAEQENRTP